MPNSAACLIELVVSAPALARPMILAFEACACSRNDEKSEVPSGCLTPPSDLAARGLHGRRGVTLERSAEGIVGGEKEPAVAAGLGQRRAGAVRQRVGVVGPVDGVRRALRVGQIRASRAGIEQDAVFLLHHIADGQRYAGVRNVDDDIDLVDIEPLARDVHADVGLVEMIAGNDVDLPSLGRHAGILDRHLGGQRRAGTAEIGVEAGLIAQRSDLDGLVLRDSQIPGGKRQGASEQQRCNLVFHIGLLLIFFRCFQTPR